jgi:hypothetical protein
MENYPVFAKNKFICPHCSTLAKQDWFENNDLSNIINNIYEQNFLSYRRNIQSYEEKAIEPFLNLMKTRFQEQINSYFPSNFSIAKCQSCNNFSVWVNKNIIYPKHIIVDTPNEDMNDDIKELYLEAAKIFADSPKGATAILRLALQKLLVQMGKDGKNINKNIKELVSDGLNPKMQQALDILRVIGNNAVHPGQIDVDDNKDVALKLFKILNMIADDMITKPKEMENLYNDIIPDEIKNHINDRDGN